MKKVTSEAPLFSLSYFSSLGQWTQLASTPFLTTFAACQRLLLKNGTSVIVLVSESTSQIYLVKYNGRSLDWRLSTMAIRQLVCWEQKISKKRSINYLIRVVNIVLVSRLPKGSTVLALWVCLI